MATSNISYHSSLSFNYIFLLHCIPLTLQDIHSNICPLDWHTDGGFYHHLIVGNSVSAYHYYSNSLHIYRAALAQDTKSPQEYNPSYLSQSGRTMNRALPDPFLLPPYQIFPAKLYSTHGQPPLHKSIQHDPFLLLTHEHQL